MSARVTRAGGDEEHIGSALLDGREKKLNGIADTAVRANALGERPQHGS
jgi:hypothetical protein